MRLRLRNLGFACVVLLLGVWVLQAQVTKFPASGANQTLNTTSDVTFAAVTTDEVTGVAGSNLTVSTANAASPDNVIVRAGNATGESNGASVTIFSGNAAVAGYTPGNISVSAGSLTGAADTQAGTVTVSGGASYSSAANKPGGGLLLLEGAGSGNAVGSGIEFYTATPTASGTDGQSADLRGSMLADVFTWDGAQKLTPRAFAALPATPAEGMIAWVNDSNTATWGATIAGGGANKVLAVYNGANWTVAGK